MTIQEVEQKRKEWKDLTDKVIANVAICPIDSLTDMRAHLAKVKVFADKAEALRKELQEAGFSCLEE